MKFVGRQFTKPALTGVKARNRSDSGFTILETAIALVLLTVVGLGIASVLLYSSKYTVSAGDRELAMAVAQQRIEQLRNANFLDAGLTATSASGTPSTVIRAGRTYSVLTTITDSNLVNGAASTKTITVNVTPQNDNSPWVTTVSSVFGSVTLVCNRTALTVGPNRAL